MMEIEKLIKIYEKFKYSENLYHKLMQRRIKNILLISTFYTSYALEENIKFSEHIIGSYHQFNLTTIPKITVAINSSHALELIKEREDFDLIISTLQIGEPSPLKLAEILKEKDEELKYLLLLTERCSPDLIDSVKKSKIDNLFFWTGDSTLFLAMIKSIEDEWNAPFDTRIGPTAVILLIEDSINYYSIYLPALLKEVMIQTQRLIKEEADNELKYLRMRTRPKVLLATNKEKALSLYEKYKDYLLCVITDIEIEREGDTFGIEFAKNVKKEHPDVPILIQSGNPDLLKIARDLEVEISYKNSPFILNDLKQFLLNKCGFGDFIFRDKNGKEIDRAKTLLEFEKKLKNIPIDSFEYHAKRKHYCMWILTRGELRLAQKLRRIKREKFKSPEKHREFLLNVFRNLRLKKIKGKVVKFDEDLINENDIVLKIGEGSLGGKGRGIAFINAFLNVTKLNKKFHNVKIDVPKSVIICTSFFDKFINDNYLYLDYDFHSDEDILNIFLNSKFPKELIEKLKIIVKNFRNPIIVRSSGLLEDSQFHPFAGIYKSVVLPNNHPSEEERLLHLIKAIIIVYASVFFKEARSYLKRLNLNIEEEKMAVIIQELTGVKFKNYFFPHISGIAQSYNFYPISYLKHEDGIAQIAIGLGKYVVEGEKSYKFCPKYPEVNYITDEELLSMTQTEFYALNLDKRVTLVEESSFLDKLSVDNFRNYLPFNFLVSTYDFQNQRVIPGIRREGALIVNFANILKYGYFPLGKILSELLENFKSAMGSEVEMEFAVNLKDKIEFKVLQIRPLKSYETIKLEDIEKIPKEMMVLFTCFGMGHGVIDDLKTIVFVKIDNFDNSKTIQIKEEIDEINDLLSQKNESYILIGPGRWGSQDRFLGIPVEWKNISGAKVIVEAGLKDFDIDPSQGTHFMHNVISLKIGYFNVPYKNKDCFIDWNWIYSQNVIIDKKFTCAIQINSPLKVIMDAKKGLYTILKPKN